MDLNTVVSIISIVIACVVFYFSGKQLKRVAADLKQTLDAARADIRGISYLLEGTGKFHVTRDADGFPTSIEPAANLRVTSTLTAAPSYEPATGPPPKTDGRTSE
jgi:hypothetical protein